MNRELIIKRCILLLAAVILIGGPAAEAFAAPASVKVLARRTISADFAAVEVPGEKLQPFWGKALNHVRLFSAAGGKLRQAPLQFDERDEAGRLVMASYTYPVAGLSRSMKKSDELVFMAADLGDRIAFADENVLEIEVTDKANKSRGWAYLRYFEESPPAPPKTDYVRYIPAHDEVIGRKYRVKFDREMHLVPTEISIEKKGSQGPNLVGKPHLKVELGKEGSFPYTRLTERDFSVKAGGYIDGPVRVVRRIKSAISFKGIFGIFWDEVDSYFYAGGFEAPLEIRLHKSMIPLGFMPRLTFIYDMSRDQNEPQPAFFNEHNLCGFALDGKDVPEDKKPQDSPFGWFAVKDSAAGEKSAVLCVTRWQNSKVEFKLLCLQGEAAKEISEKSESLLGWQTEPISNLKDDKIILENRYYIIDNLRPDRVNKLVPGLRRELEIGISGQK